MPKDTPTSDAALPSASPSGAAPSGPPGLDLHAGLDPRLTMIVPGSGSLGGPIVPSATLELEDLRFDAELGTPTAKRLRGRTLAGVLEMLGPAGEALMARAPREDLECDLRGLRLRVAGPLIQGEWETRTPLQGGAGEPWVDTPHGQARLGLLLQMTSMRGQMALRFSSEQPGGEVGVKLLRARYLSPGSSWMSRPIPAQLRGDVGRWGARPLPRGLQEWARRADAWPALVDMRGRPATFDLIWRAP